MHAKTRLSLILASLASLVPLTCQAQTPITNGLVGHWTFNAISNSLATDASGRGNAAQVANFSGEEPLLIQGKIGNALVFHGGDRADYAVVPDFPKPTNTFSVSAWAWADERATWPQSVIVENGLNGGGPIGLVIRTKNVDQAFGPLGETTTTSSGAINIQDTVGFPTASWQHVGAVADGTQLKLYRNGRVVASAAYTGELPLALGSALGIGAVLDETGTPITAFWHGRIDDVGIWTNALSEAQMAAIFAAGESGQDLSKAEAFLISPPNITTQPKNFTRFAGESVAFSVVVAGTAPFTYQWKLNDTAIAGATNAVLSIPSLKSSDAGSYKVTVSNSSGTVESSAGTLTINSADFSTGLIGYWSFDESTGELAADASPGNHPVTLAGFSGDNSQWQAGRIGRALQINGSEGEHGYVSDYEKPTSTMTASAWVWADSLGVWATFLKNWGGASAGQFHFGLFTDGRENIFIRQADGRTPSLSDFSIFPTNSWQHVAFVCDGTHLRLYRNGAEVASTTYDGTLGLPPMNCIGIGVKMADNCETPAASASGPWQGKLDDMALWKRGLNSQEIFAIFKAGQEGKGVLQAAASIPAQPIVTRQPEGASVFENVPVTLSASATGAAPLTFQWLKDGQPIVGAVTPSLNLGRATLAQAGRYRLRVSNALGTVESDEVVFTVSQRPPARLVSEWKFENNLTDTSGNGNDGAPVGTVEYIPGKYGMAVRLAPANPIIKESANNLPMSRTQSWSINLWVNLPAEPTSLAYLAGFGPVTSVGGGTARSLIAFSGPSANNITMWGNNSDTASPMRYPTNRWAMITVTYAAEERGVTLYLDGAAIATGVKTFADVPASANQISLAPTSNWSIDVGGSFDEFSIWDGVLLPGQISTLFDPNGPVALSVRINGGRLAISWPATAQGFVLESSDSLASGSWSPVAGVSGSAVEVDLTASRRFFRLKK